MENSEIKPKTILLDCDVISHFIANAALNDLAKIFEPHQCVVLDYVYNEVAVNKGIYDENKCDQFITTALSFNKACFPKGVTAMRYYASKDLSFL